MVEAHIVDIPCHCCITNDFGETQWVRGTISELEMNTHGVPYVMLITIAGKSKRIMPRFEHGTMVTNWGRRKQLRVWVAL